MSRRMELYAIPFAGQFIIYRPLRQLAFVTNGAMVRYIRDHLRGRANMAVGAADTFLDAIGFWNADPEPPPAWRPQVPHRPTTAVLLMGHECNLRCTYCYAHGGEGEVRRMSTAVATRVVDAVYENADAQGHSKFALAFHGGGEPTINWRALTAAVERAQSKSLPCEITMASNAMWTRPQTDFIVRHFSGLSISFDGIRAVQDAQRPRPDGSGSFDRVMRSIARLDEAGLRYGIRLTTTAASCARLPESVDFLCRETRCSMMQVGPCYSSSRGGHLDPQPHLARQFVAAFCRGFEIAAAAGRTLFYSGARPWVLTTMFCRAAENALVVTPDGDVVACFETYDRRHPLTDSLRIGTASAAAITVDDDALRTFMSRQRQRRDSCRRCFCYWHCAGDCMTRRSSTTGGQFGRCFVNRALTRELLAWYVAAGGGVWVASGRWEPLSNTTANELQTGGSTTTKRVKLRQNAMICENGEFC